MLWKGSGGVRLRCLLEAQNQNQNRACHCGSESVFVFDEAVMSHSRAIVRIRSFQKGRLAEREQGRQTAAADAEHACSHDPGHSLLEFKPLTLYKPGADTDSWLSWLISFLEKETRMG